ncbi:Hypothetical predicted protein, partial [Pelobates cultripes]
VQVASLAGPCPACHTNMRSGHHLKDYRCWPDWRGPKVSSMTGPLEALRGLGPR